MQCTLKATGDAHSRPEDQEFSGDSNTDETGAVLAHEKNI